MNLGFGEDIRLGFVDEAFYFKRGGSHPLRPRGYFFACPKKYPRKGSSAST